MLKVEAVEGWVAPWPMLAKALAVQMGVGGE
jgi:hypothetical protein